jgi:ABC-type lipoprotein export system ATPase subunit
MLNQSGFRLKTASLLNLIKLPFDIDKKSGCTMVLSTHDTEVMDLADQCIRIRDGMVLAAEV